MHAVKRTAYMLELSEHLFTDGVLVELGFNARNDIVNDGAVYRRLRGRAHPRADGRRAGTTGTQGTYDTQRHDLEELDAMVGE